MFKKYLLIYPVYVCVWWHHCGSQADFVSKKTKQRRKRRQNATQMGCTGWAALSFLREISITHITTGNGTMKKAITLSPTCLLGKATRVAYDGEIIRCSIFNGTHTICDENKQRTHTMVWLGTACSNAPRTHTLKHTHRFFPQQWARDCDSSKK